MAIRQKGPRLGDYFLGHRRTKATFLDEINELINWQPINAFLCKKINRFRSTGQQRTKPPKVGMATAGESPPRDCHRHARGA